MPNDTNLLSQILVKLNGADPTDEFNRDLLEVTVENSLHLPDVATIILHDARLHWIDEDSLMPGKTLQVSAKVGRLEKQIFDGEIVEIEPNFEPSTQRLLVRAFDRMHRLSRGRHTRSFVNVSDGDVINKIAAEVGLSAKVGPTSQVHPYIFQNDQTNLEFLQGRAAALGYLLFVRDQTLHCEPPQANGESISIEWGVTMREFRPRLTTIGQVQSVTARGWDPTAKDAVVGQAKKGKGTPKIGQQGDGATLAQKAFSLNAETLVVDRPIRKQAVAEALAQAVADRIAGRFVEAEGLCGGDPTLLAGASVEIKAVGNRFSGTYFVTSTLHTYGTQEGYTTQFNVSGHHPSTVLSLLAGQEESVPPTPMGLVIGLVTDNDDPDGQGRVKVKYPWLSNDHASDWARVVAPGAGDQRGIEFLPEVNDEVLVGFEMGDIHYPYVLGGLWNGKDKLPKKVTEGGKVKQRIIRSRTGHIITMDDSDDASGITIEDKSGNKVFLDSKSNKLEITVKGDTSLKAQGNFTIEAQGNLTIEAKGQAQVKGMGVKVDGGASTVDVKGSMINLN